MNYGYNALCAPAPSLSGFFGLGATAAQRKAAALAKHQTALAKRSTRQAAAKAKRAEKIAGKTVHTSAHPDDLSKIKAAVALAQSQTKNALALHARSRQTKSKVDTQKALLAANSAINTLRSMLAPVQPPPAVRKLRGMGYIGNCIQDPNDPSGATYTDDQTGVQCDPNAASGGFVDPNAGGQIYGGTQYPVQNPINSTGLVPGFGMPQFGAGSPFGSQFGAGLPGMRACRNGSNLPRCIIYQMAVDEQNQFQFVFSILQQMYAQLLSIVQQLMSQLQSAQQQPYAGQQPFNPYGQSPYDPNNPYGQYGQGGQQPAYGGQYPGPGGYPGVPYAAGSGGGDSSVIPPGYGDAGGDMSAGVPGDVSQVFPGPGQSAGAGYPMMATGGPPPGLVSSDSLPVGMDQGDGYGSSDDAGNLIPTQQQQGPNLTPSTASPFVIQTSAAPTTAQPQIIVLQQGPGQSPYADAALPAGDRQNQPGLDPQEHDDAGLTGY